MKKRIAVIISAFVLSIAGTSAYAVPSFSGKIGGVSCDAITSTYESGGWYRATHKNTCAANIDRMSLYGALYKDTKLVDGTNVSGAKTNEITGYTYWSNDTGEWFFDLVAETQHTFSHKGETITDLKTEVEF